MTGSPPWWRPDRFARRRANLDTRVRVRDAVRDFFRRQGFTEVETSALQVSPGLEPHLVAFRTELLPPGSKKGRSLYLHTSPEFAMKKLLAAGMEKIFQLAHVFRNAERSATHHPEFTMLEWYRANAGYTALMDDCEGLLRAIGGTLRWQNRTCDATQPAERLTVSDAFKRETGIDILSAASLKDSAEKIGIRTAPGDSWDDIFFRIFLERIEPKLGLGRATILYDYPVAMAALSRPKPSDPRLCERFELYVCGRELANAFGELTDAGEQRRRFAADMDLKEKRYGERYPVDEDFLAALKHGLPPSAGIALGFDRLVMLAAGADHIEDVLWAPVSGTEGE
jgi:lysyl-tRNA synthetase class 2